MSTWVMALMLGVSICVGFVGLLAFLWGLRNGQFDDKDRMMQGVLFDGIEDLNSAHDLVSNSSNKPKK